MEQGYHASAEGWQRQNCQQYQGTTASQRQGAGIQWKETFGYRFPPPKQQFQSPYVPEIPSSDNCFNPRYHYTRTTSSSESGRNHGTTTQFQPRSPQSFVNRSNPATAIFGQSRCDQNHQVPNDSWKLSSPSSLGCRSYPGVSGSSPCPREPPFGFPAGSGTSNRSFDHHHQSRLETYQPRYFNNNYIASASKPCRPRFVNSWNNSSRNKWHQHGRETNPNKKQASEKQLAPETDMPYSCDPCDKKFKSKDDLVAHQRSHVKCEFEGCSFIASRKMIKLHFIQNHEEGKFRIRLETDEDIEKWKEERRKNYPTALRVSKKMEEEQAKKRNGQVLKTKQFRYRAREPYDRNSPRGRVRGNERQNWRDRRQLDRDRKPISTNRLEEINHITQNGVSPDGKKLACPNNLTSKDSESLPVLETKAPPPSAESGDCSLEPVLVDSVTEKKPDANETVNSINQPDDVQMKKDEISDERSTVLKHEQDTQSNALSSICSYMSEDENDADTVKDQGHAEPVALDTKVSNEVVMLESPSEPVKKDVGETTTIGKDQLQRKTKERKGRLKTLNKGVRWGKKLWSENVTLDEGNSKNCRGVIT